MSTPRAYPERRCSMLRWFVALVAIAMVNASFAALPKPAGFSPETCKALLGDQPLIWRLDALKSAREAVRGDEPSVMPAYRKLLKTAEGALRRGPYSVVDKIKPAPSGDPHDYVSLAPYWWPDPGSKNGLPYIRRDGLVNPQRNGDEFDRVRMAAMAADVRALALAAYFSEDKRFSAHAEKILRVWFVDDATRMNPSLAYAQAVPGKSEGRAEGIIDTSVLPDVVDSALLLKTAGAISDDVFAGVRAWFGEYAMWLATHENAIEERAAKNNHGTFYDMQYMQYSLFAHRCNAALGTVARVRERIESQIATSGEMPLEATRSKSLHYHLFNLEAFLGIARLGEHFGLDLYTYKGKSGGSIAKTVGLVASYAGREDDWPHPQIDDGSNEYLWKILLRALTVFDDPALASAEKRATGRALDDQATLINFVVP